MKRLSPPKCKSLCAILCALCIHSFQESRADETTEFPYTLVVSSETADVLSGPGKSHYATDRLPRGTKVLIYRHDPGGFVAIRPPEGSFSLVLGSAIKPTSDPGIIEVQTKSAKAWIGSRLQGNFKPMWQLKLKQGELLNVVRKVNIPGAHSSSSESWYQVEPPRGEFRWIHKDQLQPLAPASVSAADIAGRQIDSTRSQIDLANHMDHARREAEIASTNRGGWKVMETDPQRSGGVSVNEANYQAPFATYGGSTDQQISSIDLALSQMVLAPKSSWRLSSLQQAVDQIRRDATTGQQLAEANRLAQKIIDFQKIKTESDAVSSLARSNGATTNTNSPNDRNNLVAGIRYDGRGVLRKLYTNGGVGRAMYALEDEKGKVVKTISPLAATRLK